MSEHMAGAQEILRQMGGSGRLKMMAGAAAFTPNREGEPISLAMKLGGGAKCNGRIVNYVKVTLDKVADTYSMLFGYIAKNRVTGLMDIKVRSEVKDLYVESLCEVFTANTGFTLAPPKVRVHA